MHKPARWIGPALFSRCAQCGLRGLGVLVHDASMALRLAVGFKLAKKPIQRPKPRPRYTFVVGREHVRLVPRQNAPA